MKQTTIKILSALIIVAFVALGVQIGDAAASTLSPAEFLNERQSVELDLNLDLNNVNELQTIELDLNLNLNNVNKKVNELQTVELATTSQTNPKIIGGWTQYWDRQPPSSFSSAMYGMITSLDTLTNPGNHSPNQGVPEGASSDKSLWTYGGAGCSPQGYPTDTNINNIVDATTENAWKGVDFDNECHMNKDNIIEAMKQLKAAGKETSYTFLAGADYVNGIGDTETLVRAIANAGVSDRFVLMCYGNQMWTNAEIQQFVDQAIKKTIEIVGEESKSKIILALTPVGLTDTNLDLFLGYVNDNNIGGLFVWEYSNLNDNYLQQIIDGLGIS